MQKIQEEKKEREVWQPVILDHPEREARVLMTSQVVRPVTLAEIEGPGAINHIWITVDAKTTDADCFVLRDLVLRMYWDDEDEPSVESPLGDFFCCGFGRECNINSMPIAVVPSRGLNCYFQMPFRKKARITLENQHVNSIPAFFYQVDYCLYDEGLPEDIAYFMHSGEEKRSLSCRKIM